MGALRGSSHDSDMIPPHTRVAVPQERGFAVHEIISNDFHEYRDRVVGLVLQSLASAYTNLPETALRELIDNFVHAIPCSASVVVDPSLERIHISDTGPGICCLDLALEPGYSTATERQRTLIRGVGLGFYLAEQDVREMGGELHITSEPGRGTYISISLTADIFPGRVPVEAPGGLSHRQNNILFLLTEGEKIGPSRVASELGISLSTAHRELVKLERLGLIVKTLDGKRFLSENGKSYLQSILSL